MLPASAPTSLIITIIIINTSVWWSKASSCTLAAQVINVNALLAVFTFLTWPEVWRLCPAVQQPDADGPRSTDRQETRTCLIQWHYSSSKWSRYCQQLIVTSNTPAAFWYKSTAFSRFMGSISLWRKKYDVSLRENIQQKDMLAVSSNASGVKHKMLLLLSSPVQSHRCSVGCPVLHVHHTGFLYVLDGLRHLLLFLSQCKHKASYQSAPSTWR